MPKRLLLILATVLVLAAGLTAYSAWYHSPAQTANRYLTKLAKTATVYPEDSPMNRRLRAPRLGELLANPLDIRLSGTRASGSYGHEELLSAYLSLILDDAYLQVTFSEIKLLDKSPDRLRLSARLQILSPSGHSEFPFDQSVLLEIKKVQNLLLLATLTSPNP